MRPLCSGPRWSGWFLGGVLLPGLAAALPGCLQPDPAGPRPLQDAPAFSEAGPVAPPQRWWESFDDPGLTGAVEQALGDNFNLAAAWQRLRATRAIARRTAADLYPQLDAFAAAELQTGDGEEFDQGSDRDEEYALGLRVAYEVDLWGRIGAAVRADRLEAAATLSDYRAAALSLAAEVTRTWLSLTEARLQLGLLEQQIRTNRQVLELLQSRFAAGQVQSADVLRQQRLIESTREQAIAARSRIEVLEHQLAVLTGRPAQAATGQGPPQPRSGSGDGSAPGSDSELDESPAPEREAIDALPRLPPLPATGVPAELVQRRPDVRRVWLLLEAANADLASAVRDQYPRLDLSGSLTTTASRPGELFNEWVATLAGQVVGPLIDGGRRRAEVRRTQAVSRQRLAEYGQSVLEAFAEVEDALTVGRYEAQRVTSLQRQLDLTRRTLERLRTQYLNGVIDYLPVLSALIEQQQLERDLLSAQLSRLTNRVDLYRAVAGAVATPADPRAGEAGNREVLDPEEMLDDAGVDDDE